MFKPIRLGGILAMGLVAAVFAVPSSAWIHGIASILGVFFPYDNHADLLAAAHAPGVGASWTLMQQGYYVAGDGGAATYDWNASSYCPGGTSGAPTAADSVTCILPPGQLASAAGRYLLRPSGGRIDARILGFHDDGADNSSLIPTLNTVLSTAETQIVFSPSRVNPQANYWFSQPLDVAYDGSIACGDGTHVGNTPSVNLVFTPGVEGVRFLNTATAVMQGYPSTAGVTLGNLSGCGVISTGFSQNTVHTVAGSTTVNNSRFTTPSQIANGVRQTEPVPAIGDSIVLFPLNTPYWNFSGSVTGSTLTVTSTPTGTQSTTDPGISDGQMLRGTGLPHGIFISATNADNPSFTGTGGTGTYGLSYSIAGPPVASEAVTGTLTTSFNTEVQSGPTMVPPGTTITGCSTLSGTQCPLSGTLTLSNAPNLGVKTADYLLPGPNSLKGSQQYSITTSLTGTTYGSMTAGISNGSGLPGTILNVTAGAGSLNLGHTVIGVAGATTPATSTTTTSALTIGENSSIPVASCSGVTAGMYVVGFDSGSPVFPPGTTVASCSGTSLAVNTVSNAFTVTTSGSPVVRLRSYYTALTEFWVGEPITGTNIAANSTIQSWAFAPYDSTYIFVTLSQNATGTQSSGTSLLGGAIDAAPSSTTLTFLAGSATVSALGTGTGGTGTYTLTSSVLLAPGSTLYSYDTPGTVYVTNGPRNIMPQDLIWTDAFPFGAMAAQVYGSSPTKETILASPTIPIINNGHLSATVAHTSGTGAMWILPTGLMRNTRGNSSGNAVYDFGVGVNMACAQDEYPETGCGKSRDSDNDFEFNMLGRLTAGNNSGGAISEGNEYDHNYVADVAELATVGSTYLGEMMQGADESTNTHDVISGCGTNGSPFIGTYTSGSEWSGVCLQHNIDMATVQASVFQNLGGGAWSGSIWDVPFTPNFTTNALNPQVSCSGAPTASFAVTQGVVTHC